MVTGMLEEKENTTLKDDIDAAYTMLSQYYSDRWDRNWLPNDTRLSLF